MDKPSRGQVGKVAFAGVVGTTIEWYDFFISGTAAGVAWPLVFFPKEDPNSALLLSVITFGIGFITRPVGAFLFGHFGDKIGRKSTLIWTLVTMGLGTLLIGLTPPYTPTGIWGFGIGIWGGVLVAIFRLVQGLGVGGEWGGASTWVTEFAANSKYRAFWASWVQQGVPLGLVFANGLYFYLTNLLTLNGKLTTSFYDWGWRIPFFIGAIVVIVGVIIRYKLLESPIFSQILQRREIERVPMGSLLKNQWVTVLLCAIGWWYVNAMFYIITAFSQGYIKLVNPTMPGYVGPFSIMIAGIVSVFITILGSLAADKFGRRIVIVASAIGSGILALPYVYMLTINSPYVIYLAQTMELSVVLFGYSVLSAFFSEQFPAKYRYTGSGFSYHIAAPFSGGLAPILAGSFTVTYGSIGAAPYIAILGIAYCLTSAIAVALTKETLKKEISY